MTSMDSSVARRAGSWSLALLLAGCGAAEAPASPAASSATCCVGADVRWGEAGGYQPGRTERRLRSCDEHIYRFESDYDDMPSEECISTLPACGTRDAITPADVARALRHPDVVDASDEVYGPDDRSVDVPVHRIEVDTQVILFGTGCRAEDEDCPVPEGILELAELLTRLDRQQRSRCATLTAGGRPTLEDQSSRVK